MDPGPSQSYQISADATDASEIDTTTSTAAVNAFMIHSLLEIKVIRLP